MKNVIIVITHLFIVGFGNSQDNEKRINFNKGTLKISSNSQMTIKGYDGDEVIIKSYLKEGSNTKFYLDFTANKEKKTRPINFNYSDKRGFYLNALGQPTANENKDLEVGLKPLGETSSASDMSFKYLDITKTSDELIIGDFYKNKLNRNLFLSPNDYKIKSKFYRYELLVPNTLKLLWKPENSTKQTFELFLNELKNNSNKLLVSDFSGEVEITTTNSSMTLENVSGPVIANTISGNITLVYDGTTPTKLCSLISNNGYIDVTMPEDANLNIDAKGNRILSNIDFTLLNNEITVYGTKRMELLLNSGEVKMKLDTSTGSIYLRKIE